MSILVPFLQGLAAADKGSEGLNAKQKAENVNAFAALLNAIQASKQSQDLAKAMRSLKEEQKRQEEE